MNFLLRYFGRKSDESRQYQPVAGCATGEQRRREGGRRDEYQEETSFNWLGESPISSSIFDPPYRPGDAAGVSDTLPCKTIAAPPPADGDKADAPGFDPYNTGSIAVPASRGRRSA